MKPILYELDKLKAAGVFLVGLLIIYIFTILIFKVLTYLFGIKWWIITGIMLFSLVLLLYFIVNMIVIIEYTKMGVRIDE